MRQPKSPRVFSKPLIATACFIAWGFFLGDDGKVYGQAEWISRLDDNRNGYIEPNEISERARPYFERFARENGISLSRPNSIGRLESAARRYFERRSERERDDNDVQPQSGSKIKGFGIEKDASIPAGFGVAKLKYPYALEDVEEAERTFERYDRDDDGFLDRREAERARWTESNPYEDDANRDGLLSRMELIQRYAKRRAKSQGANGYTFGPTSNADSEPDSEAERRERERSYWRDRWRDRGSRELASNVIERYDFNRNNLLDPAEVVAAGFDVGKADFNRDGTVERDELTRWLSEEMDVQGDRMSDQLPVWFFERDTNNDRQLEMAEFTDQWDEQKAEEFSSYDLNSDGILTVEELLSSNTIVGGRFSNQDASILLPRGSIISEIAVDEDYIIGDLNLQLSITHTYTEHLDAYLMGPNGQQVELFTGVGGSDDHFDRTVFNDDAGENIARSRPPFRGEYQPEALLKRQPGLNQFKGQNLKGIWQLIVRSSRSERSGILHNWSLIVKPAEKDEYAIEEPAPAPIDAQK